MHIKIQGGGSGDYANTGSSYGVTLYLRHEDKEQLEKNKIIEPFFSYDRTFVPPTEVVSSLDNNKAKLGRNDAKFFILTISPSKEEIRAMGRNPIEQSERFKDYINKEIMKHYADGFNKNLEAKDLLYFAKIHHARGEKEDEQMHAHVIVSRKDRNNKIKLSPQTNHRSTKKGIVKGGFDRTSFYQASEISFDKHFKYARALEDSFSYKNVMKNGTIAEKVSMERKMQRENLKSEQLSVDRVKEHKEELEKIVEQKIEKEIIADIKQERPRYRGRGM